MPTELVKKINLDALYPGFLPRFLELLARCQTRGANYYASYGLRTFDEQAAIYAQGRTTPGPKVTNAPAGYSVHNYGAAVDLVRDADLARVGLQPNWAADGYQILAEEGATLGLQVGVPGLADLGHCQLPLTLTTGRREKAMLEDLKTAYETGGGMPAAWALLDQWGFAA